MNRWFDGELYEAYVGRWSRLVAREFVPWLKVPGSGRWLDVGCGTGALTEAVLERGDPSDVIGVDPSNGLVEFAATHVTDPRASFRLADAQVLPVDDGSIDAVVSGLVLNFIPDRRAGLSEMRRVTRQDGVVAAYVWDYAGEMALMKYFWDTAGELDPAALPMDEGERFAFCRPGPLRQMFDDAGFDDVDVQPIVVPTTFVDFDDYWAPFLSGQAPAPAYAMSLSDDDRAALREALRATLPVESDGSIRLTARAWAVRAVAR